MIRNHLKMGGTIRITVAIAIGKGNSADLNMIDTAQVTDMSSMFSRVRQCIQQGLGGLEGRRHGLGNRYVHGLRGYESPLVVSARDAEWGNCAILPVAIILNCA